MRSSRMRLACLTAALLGMSCPSAFAVTINFATGQDGSGNIQTAGDSLDANWTESGAVIAKSAPNSYVVAPNNADWYSGWFANGTNSSWIAPNPDNANGNGNYTLTYTFSLTGFNRNTAVFSGGQWSIDDAGHVDLNGHVLNTQGNGQWGSFHTFTFPNSDLVAGVNLLTINSTDSDTFLEAARLEGTLTVSRAVTGVPEPGTLTLLGMGLAGFGVLRRRKKPA